MSDKKERETVRENYLKKKLGLANPDGELDEAVVAVGQRMKADRTKNRVTVYYLLAEHFGLLNIFGGVAGAVGAAGAAGLAAAALGGGDDSKDEGGSAVPLAAAGLGAAAIGGAAAAAAPEPAPAAPEPVAAAPAYAASSYDDDASAGAGGGWGWLKWLLLAAILVATLFFVLRSCGTQDAMAPAEPDAAATTTEATPATTPTGEKTAEPAATAATPAAAPTGSGVVAGERNGKPMLTIYFDQAKTNIPADFEKVAAAIKDYAAKNPGAKFAVSGFNSPTGSAAANARLSKGRAENVGAALQKLGVPAGAIALVKPAEATQGTGEDAQARRVEVTVQ
jgi:outer membrane protein OmpA-like peptidoglycan-associated protein